MKRNLSLFSIAVACTLGYPGVAAADDIAVDPVPFTSSTSRAAVRSDLDSFKQSGVNPWSIRHDPLRNFRSGRTRAEVTAEFIRDRQAVAATHGEDSGSVYLARLRDPTRAPVHLATKRHRGPVDGVYVPGAQRY